MAANFKETKIFEFLVYVYWFLRSTQLSTKTYRTCKFLHWKQSIFRRNLDRSFNSSKKTDWIFFCRGRSFHKLHWSTSVRRNYLYQSPFSKDIGRVVHVLWETISDRWYFLRTLDDQLRRRQVFDQFSLWKDKNLAWAI